ncbi:MAG: phosphotransferase enzyme family protein [Akkermansiaceae bacterium]
MLKKEHLELILRPYGIDAAQLEFIRRSQNYVYRVGAGQGDIVRICKGRYREEKDIEAELLWIEYLTQHGVKACRPIISNEGKLYHSVEIDGELHVVTVFEHAPGMRMHSKMADEATFEKLGRLTGCIHALATKFESSGGSLNRSSWMESRLLKEDFDDHLDVLSPVFVQSVESSIEELSSIPKSPGCFGILHGDIHFGNIFDDSGDLWIFDFDNCEYGYFVQELATILWDAVYCKEMNKFADDGLSERMRTWWQALLKGYFESSPMEENDLNYEQLEKFFLLRESVIYVHYHQTLNLTEIDESFHEGLEVMKRNVETQSHQVDFSLLKREL